MQLSVCGGKYKQQGIFMIQLTILIGMRSLFMDAYFL